VAARRSPKAATGKARLEKVQPSLMEVALTKLDHRDRTKQQLRQLLTRKAAERTASSADADATARPPPASQEQIDEVLSRLEASGVINDHRYAEHYARSARARGASQAKVQQMLGRRGVERKSVEEALGALAGEGLDELAAARSYVKRRRLVERYDLSDPKQRQKALASLGRQGFSSNTALLALGAEGRSDVPPDDD
jgi:SOS response regulatory protein OraA/RecX